MLGRRLLLLVAVLLATGAIAAALTPRELRKSSPTTTTAPPPSVANGTGGTPAGARQVIRIVNAAGARPAVVRATVGDLLQLAVRVTSPEEVALVGTGRFATADADTPARFNFFLDSAGTFPIHLQESGRDVGRLVVRPR